MAIRTYMMAVTGLDRAAWQTGEKMVNFPLAGYASSEPVSLVFYNGTGPEKRFVQYGLADTSDFVSETPANPRPVRMDMAKVLPWNALDRAVALFDHGGVVYVEESLLDAKNRQALDRLCAQAPRLKKIMDELFMRI